jgi:hypothetical protein
MATGTIVTEDTYKQAEKEIRAQVAEAKKIKENQEKLKKLLDDMFKNKGTPKNKGGSSGTTDILPSESPTDFGISSGEDMLRNGEDMLRNREELRDKMIEQDTVYFEQQRTLMDASRENWDLYWNQVLTNGQKVSQILNKSWSNYYDSQQSLIQNWLTGMKEAAKGFVISYLEGLQQTVIAETAAGIARAISNKAFHMIPLITAQGAAAVTAIQAAKGAVGGLATGGIVTGETLTRIGEENRKEAVIPLETPQGRRILNETLDSGNRETSQNITLQIDGMTLAEIMTNKQAEGRTQGRF